MVRPKPTVTTHIQPPPLMHLPLDISLQEQVLKAANAATNHAGANQTMQPLQPNPNGNWPNFLPGNDPHHYTHSSSQPSYHGYHQRPDERMQYAPAAASSSTTSTQGYTSNSTRMDESPRIRLGDESPSGANASASPSSSPSAYFIPISVPPLALPLLPHQINPEPMMVSSSASPGQYDQRQQHPPHQPMYDQDGRPFYYQQPPRSQYQQQPQYQPYQQHQLQHEQQRQQHQEQERHLSQSQQQSYQPQSQRSQLPSHSPISVTRARIAQLSLSGYFPHFTLDVATNHSLMTAASPTSQPQAQTLARARRLAAAAEADARQKKSEEKRKAEETAAEEARVAKSKKRSAAAAANKDGTSSNKKQKREPLVGEPPPPPKDDVQFEVERILAKRIRLVKRSALRKMHGMIDSLDVTAEDGCVNDYKEFLKEEQEALKRTNRYASSTAASSTTAAAASSSPTAVQPFYSLLDPNSQLPLCEFLIRWKGYTSADDGWEPRWNIHHSMIQEFEKELQEKKRIIQSGHATPQAIHEFQQLLQQPKASEIDTKKKATGDSAKKSASTAAAATSSKPKPTSTSSSRRSAPVPEPTGTSDGTAAH